jgi:predicted CXXCH cytochrome family protein
MNKNMVFIAITLCCVTLLVTSSVHALSEQEQQQKSSTDQCLTCHSGLGDKPSTLFKHDVHAGKGISCAGCHGGNPHVEEMEQAMDSSKGYIGVPKGDRISEACANCHSNSDKMKSYGSALPTNQWEMLQTSVHGKLSITGKAHIAQCITCHGAHGIVSVKNPASPVYPLNVVKTCATCHANAAYMRDYNPALPVDQIEKYRTSVHGEKNAKGDPKVAACASCHGSHDIRSEKDVKSKVYAENIPATCSHCHSDAAYMKEYNIATDQYEKFAKSVHGNALLKKHDIGAPACNDCHGNHGATPPGVESVSKVCGTCHALNADLFSSSPHKKAFDEGGLPECETCHSNHEIVAATDKLLGVSSDAVCSQCHQNGDPSKGYAVAKTMRELTDSLDLSVRRATSLIDEAEQKGMEITESKFKLRDAHQARLQSRTMVHSFDEAKFRDVVGKGLSVATLVAGEGKQTIDEYYFRRWGLGVATVIISIVTISLYFTVRRIERKQRERNNR